MVVLLLLVAAVLLWRGWGFYGLSLDDRVVHPEYRKLRPAGELGHGYGIFGTFLILTNLLYLARRRFASLSLGSMRTWLDVHVFTGLCGAMFITFHSAFQMRSAVATATVVSLAVVVVTGLLGRYLYALAPDPESRALEEAVDALEGYLPGVRSQVTKVMSYQEPVDVETHSSLIRSLSTLPYWMRQARERREAVELIVSNADGIAALEPAQRKHVDRLCRQASRAAATAVRGVAVTAVLRSWRSLHRFFAILMVLAVAVHIGVAWYYGFRWLLSE